MLSKYFVYVNCCAEVSSFFCLYSFLKRTVHTETVYNFMPLRIRDSRRLALMVQQ